MNFQEAFEYVNDLLIENGQHPFTQNEAKDWAIQDAETFDALDQIVNNYMSEIASEKAADRHYTKYGY